MTGEAALELATAARRLAELLEAAAGWPAAPTRDLSIEDLADRLGRKASTIRGWCERGLFPGAYHLPASGKQSKAGRPRVGAWRIPEPAVEAFRNRGSGKSITAWRHQRGKANGSR